MRHVHNLARLASRVERSWIQACIFDGLIPVPSKSRFVCFSTENPYLTEYYHAARELSERNRENIANG
jgi:hypothetical protein